MTARKMSKAEYARAILEKLKSHPEVSYSARDLEKALERPGSSYRIRTVCEELAEAGLLARKEIRSESAPYGPPAAVRYRLLKRKETEERD